MAGEIQIRRFERVNRVTRFVGNVAAFYAWKINSGIRTRLHFSRLLLFLVETGRGK